MKKIFLAGIVAISLAAVAATPAKQKARNVSNDVVYYQDTVPGKKKPDTLPKPVPDSPPSMRLVMLNK